jgi:hypothetical protein
VYLFGETEEKFKGCPVKIAIFGRDLKLAPSPSGRLEPTQL